MKIVSNKLIAHLANEPASAYLIINNEPLLQAEDRDAIRKAFSCDERRFYLVDNSFDAELTLNEASEGNLFGQKLLFDFILPDHLTATLSETLKEITSMAISNDHCVIVSCKRLASRAKWNDALEDVFTVVKEVAIPRERLTGWIAARAKHKNLNLDQDAVQYIAANNEGNLDAAAQEIEKLLIVHGEDNNINIAMIDSAISEQSCYDLRSLRESLAAGNITQVVKAVRYLKAAKETPVLLVWALAEEGRALLALKDKSNPWGIFGTHRTNLVQIAQRIARKDISAYLTAVARCDWVAKGLTNTKDPWLLIERVACSFALLARNNRLERNLLS